jgi:transcriptional regulator with XRE-family HTH domain
MNDYTPTSGSELRRQRLALGAQQQEVASILGLTRISVWRLEHRAEVPVLVARRYHDALDQLAKREGAR